MGGGVPGLLHTMHRLDMTDQDVSHLAELGRGSVVRPQTVGAGAAQTAQQGRGGVALQRGVRGQVEDELVELATLRRRDQLGEIAPPLGDDQDAAAAGVELLGEVDHEVEASGAGRRGHREVLPGQDPGQHAAMVGIDGGDQLVLGDVRHLLVGLVAAHHGLRLGVTREGGDHGRGDPVGPLGREILGHGAGGVHEVADHEGVGDTETGQRLSEGAEGVEHGGGVEAVGAVRGREQRAGIDRDTGFAQRAQQHGVQIGGGVDLEVDVLAGIAAQAQRDRTHQHGGVDRGGAVLRVPGGLADAEMAGGQADLLRMALGDLADGAGVSTRVGQGPHLPHQGGQSRRAAAGEQLGEAGRVRVGQVQDGRAGAELGEERGGRDAAGDLLRPPVQGVGDQVLAAEGAVLTGHGGEVVLILLRGDPGSHLVEVTVHDHVVTARAGCAHP